MNPDMAVRIGSLTLKNPVGLASGTAGYGQEYESLMDIDALGALYTKAVTPEPREGNPPPRLVETPAGMINSIGLANPGLAAFIETTLPALRRRRCAVIVNVAGASEEDYLRVVEGIEAAAGAQRAALPAQGAAAGTVGSDAGARGASWSAGAVDAYEINVSCPNVRHGGMAFGTDPAQVERLTRALTAVSSRPIIVKLSPNVTDIAEIARAAEAGGADALSCINTVVGMVIDVKRRRSAIAMGTGGLSGPAIRPIGVACVYKVARAVNIPVIGLGGIICAEDALQYLLAGACALQLGTGTFVDPGLPARVLSGIETWMRQEGVARVADIRHMLL